MASISTDKFIALAASAQAEHEPAVRLAIPVAITILSDQLTPVLAYRRLVANDERTDPSFLLESVEGGERQGRHSILGADPSVEVVAIERDVSVVDRRTGGKRTQTVDDPLETMRALSQDIRFVRPPAGALPDCALGGWFGYAAYDTVRYAEPEKLSFENAPPDDRQLPDLSFAFYDTVVVFDSVEKLVYLVRIVLLGEHNDSGAAYDEAIGDLRDLSRAIQTHSKPLPAGEVSDLKARVAPMDSNITRDQHAEMLSRAKEYICAGDIFQVVIGQRFEKKSTADPFDVYRALRAVNPSPYMVYMQGPGCILVASSPEILCRVRRDEQERLIVTNRPLAGTRRRGASEEEDIALERELLADAKERAEHVMLVDLGRNDVGRVTESGRVELPAVMEIERYSHVMHISSTVTGALRDGLDCWDALRAALPVGTISGAPKIRAMQIIDELEPCRRGPYGGGMGYVSLEGEMDIALALRTMIVPTAMRADGRWVYHIQAAGGIVADSDPGAEFDETVNKAAALGRAIEVGETAFSQEC